MEYIELKNYPCMHGYKIKKTEIDKIDFALCREPSETLESYYSRQKIKPTLLSNGGFFDTSNGGTIFTYVDDKKVLAYQSDLVDGIGVKDNGELVLGKYNSSYRDFVCGYPVLIKNGQPVSSKIGSEIDYNARRTILGYDDNYVYLLAVELPGYKFSKVKTALLSLGIKNAINLDGGGSTRILENGKRITKTVASRAVDNVVAFYINSKKTVYRVQTGAFSKEENAKAYVEKIRKLNDSIGAGYKNAYVRKIGILYKVQVGAFSKKENAEKVMNDLKSKGYGAFITTE